MPSNAANDVTIRDIAARAGVSISTVHYALRRTRPISDATRERVLRAVEELDYQPHAAAAALPSGRTQRIAVVIAGIEPAFANTYFSDFIRGLAAAAEAEEHNVVLVTAYGRRVAQGWRPVHLLRRREADALVLAGTQFVREHLDELAEAGAPCVLLNHEHPGLASVMPDRAQGTELAARHLLNLGRYPVGLLAADFPGGGPLARRPELAGVRAAHMAAGAVLDERLLRFVSVHLGAADVTTTLVHDLRRSGRGRRPGLVVFSYTLAPAASIGIVAAGGNVPNELAVAFGDEDTSYDESLGLAPTVVQAPKFEMAQTAIAMAIARLRGELPADDRRRMPMELRVRESCGGRTEAAHAASGGTLVPDSPSTA